MNYILTALNEQYLYGVIQHAVLIMPKTTTLKE